MCFDGCGKDDDQEMMENFDFDIYVSDVGGKILKYKGAGLTGEAFVTGNLSWPQDIVFLESDNSVLISDLPGNSIMQCNATTGAFIRKFASGIAGPTRMKIGKDNLLYVLQWAGDGKVLRYQLDGTFVDAFTETGVFQSIGMDWDTQGNLYVSSYNRSAGGIVRKFDAQGRDLGIFVGPSSITGPTNIWFNTSGELLVVDYGGGSVRRFGADGKFIKNEITGLNQPEGVAVLPDGRILIGNGGTGTVKMYDQNFTFLKDLIAKGSAGLGKPNAVVIRKN